MLDSETIDTARKIKQNWLAIQRSVGDACALANRPVDSVRIVGVTKYVDAATTQLLVDAGCVELGESRPQVLWQKHPTVQAADLRWHMIGHLQRNKVARTVPLITMLHSLDSVRLAESISQTLVAQSRTLDCLIEVNISGEEAKTGTAIGQVADLIQQCQKLPGIRICGLMGMASELADESQTAVQFSTLRELQKDLRLKFSDDSHPLDELSMGMSGDFKIAIANGATIIRIGSTLFEGIDTGARGV